MQKVISVVKMRRSAHSQGFWRYEVTETGAVIGEPLTGFQGILSGSPERLGAGVSRHADSPMGLTVAEAALLHALVRSGESSLAALATATGFAQAQASELIERLVRLRYAERNDAAGDAEATYRAVARAAR